MAPASFTKNPVVLPRRFCYDRGTTDTQEADLMQIKRKKTKKGAVKSAVGGIATMACSYLILAAINAFLDKTRP